MGASHSQKTAVDGVSRLVTVPSVHTARAARTVLVINDDPDVSEVLRALLESVGYAVEIAGDGAEGLRKLVGDPRPDAVLLDLVMPAGMNGFEFRRRQRNDPALAKIPVIVTSSAFDVYGTSIADLHADGYVQLSSSLGALFELLERSFARATR